jgi:hypothetical protein
MKFEYPIMFGIAIVLIILTITLIINTQCATNCAASEKQNSEKVIFVIFGEEFIIYENVKNYRLYNYGNCIQIDDESGYFEYCNTPVKFVNKKDYQKWTGILSE